MHAGISAGVAGNELGGLVDVDVVFVAVVVLPAFFGPPCVCVLVGQFVGLVNVLAPLNGQRTGFNEGTRP